MEVKTITMEITTESEAYKLAKEFSEKNSDISMFDTPEKVLENVFSFNMGVVSGTLEVFEKMV